MEIKQFAELKKNYVTRVVGDEMVVVPLTDKVAQMSTLYTLNETGKFIWEHSGENTTLDLLAALLVENFDIDTETAKADIQEFFNNTGVKLQENKEAGFGNKTEEKPKGKTVFRFWKNK